MSKDEMTTSARVVADSLSTANERIITLEVTFHRFMLPEFNTHRVFSRNSASSRAIPTKTMLERVLASSAQPLVWRYNQPGMVGGDYLSREDEVAARAIWDNARDDAVRHAQRLTDLGVHKSVVNRLIEPFSWHTVVVTSTFWRGFFEQRIHPAAQDEIRVAAEHMQRAINASTPVKVPELGYHLPFVLPEEHTSLSLPEKIMISVARCARVSYMNHGSTKIDIEADFKLYHRLHGAQPPHASPFEHVAQESGDSRMYANFIGWQSQRSILGI